MLVNILHLGFFHSPKLLGRSIAKRHAYTHVVDRQPPVDVLALCVIHCRPYYCGFSTPDGDIIGIYINVPWDVTRKVVSEIME